MTQKLILSLAAVAAVACAQADAPKRTHAFKSPAKMEMLRPGEVKPQGWLRDWCVTARNGYISVEPRLPPARQVPRLERPQQGRVVHRGRRVLVRGTRAPRVGT